MESVGRLTLEPLAGCAGGSTQAAKLLKAGAHSAYTVHSIYVYLCYSCLVYSMFILFSQAISIDVSQYSQNQWFVLQLSSYCLFIGYTVIHVYVIFSAGSLGHGDSLHFLSCPYPLVVTLEWDPSPRHAAESSKLPLCDSRSSLV